MLLDLNVVGGEAIRGCHFQRQRGGMRDAVSSIPCLVKLLFLFFLFSFMGILHHIYLILMTAVDGLSMSLLSSMANISALTRVSFFGVYVCAYDAHLLDR